MSKSKTALANYLSFLGLPSGLLPAMASTYKAQNIRILILDNSYSMRKPDATLLRASAEFSKIDKKDGASRWAELSQCVEFHVKMAARCGMPTQVRLVNEEAESTAPRKFSVCWNKGGAADVEKEQALAHMKAVRLDRKANPLARQIRKVEKYLSGEADTLRKNGHFVSVVICTHGIPTDEEGHRGRVVTKDFIDSLVSLANLPVKIIFRLCTDNDDVVDFFNSLDAKIDCDVLDDFWGEAMEVYLHNPWLTYGIGLHRIREAGLGTELMDDLDEKAFTIDDIKDFCLEFLVGNNNLSLRNPKIDFDGFIHDLQVIVDKEKPVWNPVKNKLCPWIDVNKLRLMYAKKQSKVERPLPAFARRNSHEAPESRSSGNRINSRVQNAFHKSMHAGMNINASDTDFGRNTSTRSGGSSTKPNLKHHPTNLDGSSINNGTSSSSNNNNIPPPKDLKEYIQQWSHEAPSYKKLKPLEVLLVDVPNLFPPANSFVESHAYYFKWKAFSEDAFNGESGDELKELLRRASRKSKLFLHPDKLPRDLTENQDVLFKSIWNVIQESEAATLQ